MSNSLSFAGNLGGDAEVRYTLSGTAVLLFSVAMSSGYGDNKKTDWVRVSMFGKVAESTLKNFLRKGTSVFVSGECSINTYLSHDGTTKASINLIAHSVDLVGKKQETETNTETPAKPKKSAKRKTAETPATVGNDVPFDNDIPF